MMNVGLVLALPVFVAWAIRELVLFWMDHRSVKQLEKALLQKRETQ